MAKKKQKRAPRISDQKREEMFQAFCEKQNCDYVATKCGVSWHTAAKWRDKDDWDGRLQKIRDKAMKKADSAAADMLARHIKGAQFFQAKGLKFIQEEGIDTTANAITAYQVGVRIEREASGEPGAIIKTVGSEFDALSIEELKKRLQELRQLAGR